MFRNKTGMALRDLLESQGEDMAIEIVHDLIESKKIRPEDFSLREMWEACQAAAGYSTDVQESLVSSAFPKLTGELINSRLIGAYNAQPVIGESLVTTVPSNQQIETIAGLTATETLEEVGEGMAVNDSTMAEKYVTGQNKKYERMISITEETIMFDKTGQILQRAMTIGANARRYKERLIMRGVQDVSSDVWRPSGVPTAMYSAGNYNLITSNSFGESGMEAVIKQAQMMKSDALGTNADDDYIFIDTNNLQVLVPADLIVEAWQLANTAKTPESAENADNYFKGRFSPFSSPHVTAQSTTTWYTGEFPKAFWWLEVWPIQTLSAKPGNSQEFLRDIKAMHKVRMFGSIVCVEPKYVFKCTA